MIDVPDEKIEGPDSLLDAAIKLAPVRSRDGTRDNVEGKDTIDGRAVAINREGYSECEKLAFRILRPFAKLRKFKLLKAMPKSG